MPPHPMDMTAALQNAKTRADHQALARHYEEAAAEMQTKVEAHKKRLEYYEKQRYVEPNQWPLMADHCRSLIGFYQGAARENQQLADLHRQVAAKLDDSP